MCEFRSALLFLLHMVGNDELKKVIYSPKQARAANPFLPADQLIEPDHPAAIDIDIIEILFARDHCPFQEMPAEAEHIRNIVGATFAVVGKFCFQNRAYFIENDNRIQRQPLDAAQVRERYFVAAIASVVLDADVRPKTRNARAHNVKIVTDLYLMILQQLVLVVPCEDLRLAAVPIPKIILQPFPHFQSEDPSVVNGVRGLAAAGLSRVDAYRVPEIQLTIARISDREIRIEFSAIIHIEHDHEQFQTERQIDPFPESRDKPYRQYQRRDKQQDKENIEQQRFYIRDVFCDLARREHHSQNARRNARVDEKVMPEQVDN